MRIVLSIVMLFLAGHISFAQEDDMDEDSKPIRVPKFSTKGLYLCAGVMASEIGTYTNNNLLDTSSSFGIHSSFLCQVQMEFKHNLAVNAGYAFSPVFSHDGKKMQSINYEVGGHFPCYRSFKKQGIYLESGFSLRVVQFFNSSVSPTNDESHTEKKYFNILNAIGYEYKFRHIQLYTVTRFSSVPTRRLTLSEALWNFGTINYIIGMRIKLPSLYKTGSDRYHWI